MTDIYVGIRKGDDDEIPESDLRQHVCPSCGNVDILTGDAELDKDVKPILAGDMLDEEYGPYSSGGGFTEFCYRYLPHKCTACGARFTAVKRGKAKLNMEVVGWVVSFAFLVAAHIALSMVLIAHGAPVVGALCGVAAPLLLIYANILSKIDENTLDKDPGPDYICEHGLSDAAFRRLEDAYEKETEEEEEEDLNEIFSSDEKKTVQEVFESLTPEQKMAVEHLIGDVKQKELELLRQRLQAQPHYILQDVDPRQIYADGKPLIFPQPAIRPWDIHPW